MQEHEDHIPIELMHMTSDNDSKKWDSTFQDDE